MPHQKKILSIIFLPMIILLIPIFNCGVVWAEEDRIIPASSEMVMQANAPLSSIMQVRVRNTYIPRFTDIGGRGNVVGLDMTMPLPAYRFLPIRHLTLLNVPLAITYPKPLGGETGFGDLRFTDIGIVHEGNRFLWGIGPIFVFPTATDQTTGEGKWQAGPAAAAAVKLRRSLAGVVFQNPISFAGHKDRDNVSSMILQPFVTYQLGKGWFIRSQPQIIFGWRTGKKVLPLDLGVGRTFKIGRQTVNCYVEPFWNFSSSGHPPQYGIAAGISFLYPNFWKKYGTKAERD